MLLLCWCRPVVPIGGGGTAHTGEAHHHTVQALAEEDTVAAAADLAVEDTDPAEVVAEEAVAAAAEEDIDTADPVALAELELELVFVAGVVGIVAEVLAAASAEVAEEVAAAAVTAGRTVQLRARTDHRHTVAAAVAVQVP